MQWIGMRDKRGGGGLSGSAWVGGLATWSSGSPKMTRKVVEWAPKGGGRVCGISCICGFAWIQSNNLWEVILIFELLNFSCCSSFFPILVRFTLFSVQTVILRPSNEPSTALKRLRGGKRHSFPSYNEYAVTISPNPPSLGGHCKVCKTSKKHLW